MDKRKIKLTIICEDSQQECFARKFLTGMGWHKRQLRILKSSSGKGSGEQWVRDNYAKELAVYRSSHVNYAFIAIVDGDTKGVKARIQQFNDRCVELDIAVRSEKERVAIVVPTRNIETWIAYLEGREVNEITAYPKLSYKTDCKNAVNNLLQYCKNVSFPDDAPNSLQAACNEFQTRIR